MIDLKDLKESICKFLGHGSLTTQIPVFPEFAFIFPAIRNVFCNDKKDLQSENPYALLQCSQEASNKNYVHTTTQGPHKMEAKKTVVKMMVVEFQNNFMNSSFCSLCC